MSPSGGEGTFPDLLKKAQKAHVDSTLAAGRAPKLGKADQGELDKAEKKSRAAAEESQAPRSKIFHQKMEAGRMASILCLFFKGKRRVSRSENFLCCQSENQALSESDHGLHPPRALRTPGWKQGWGFGSLEGGTRSGTSSTKG